MQNKRQKSLKLNMALNAIKGLMSILFPLITFPYVSRVLGVDNIGRYNFANSIISYFVLLAGLGINTYAIREGARIRDSFGELESFSSEMLSINIWSSVASYGLFLILMFTVSKFQNYKVLLLIFSLQVIFKPFGIEWLYSVFEDYVYITIRSIVFQVISLILLFSFVKTKEDLYKYAIITVFSGVGTDLYNFFYSRKYICIKPTRSINWKRHFKPIIVLFAMSATVMIYVSSDITILGLLTDDYTIGVYSVSTKVYQIVKTVLSSVLVVSIPRISAMLGQSNEDEFKFTANDIYKTLITVVVPAITGIVVLRKEVVLLISNVEFISATTSLALLSIALFFCMGAWFWGQCILVPCKKESIVFKITIISAVVNIISNFILIPFWKEKAAAFTTIVAEGLSFIWCGLEGRKVIKMTSIWMQYLKVLLGCLIIMLVGHTVHAIGLSDLINVCIIVPLSVVLYFGVEIMLKNDSITGFMREIRNRIK